MSWGPGADRVEAALEAHELSKVTGGQTAGETWVQDAGRKCRTARQIVDDDPESAFNTAYDGARFCLVGVLAQQGLRATSTGGHVVIERVVRAQFGQSFEQFGALRRRRNELEYPAYPGERIDADEVLRAIATIEAMIENAEQLLPHLSLFR